MSFQIFNSRGFWANYILIKLNFGSSSKNKWLWVNKNQTNLPNISIYLHFFMKIVTLITTCIVIIFGAFFSSLVINTILSYIHRNVFIHRLTEGDSAPVTCPLWSSLCTAGLCSHLSPAYFPGSISSGILMSDAWRRVLSLYRSWKFMTIMEKYNRERQKREGKKEWIKCAGSDVKWLKQFLFKCKFDFLKDGTTRNCTLNGKMKINLKYGMNKAYVDFLGIIFYYENSDAFSFAQSILDFGQLCLGWKANILQFV